MGKNLLKPANTFFVKYGNVDGLRASNPVRANGVQIGSVLSVEIDPDNYDSVLVTLDIPRNVSIPKNSIATIVSPSPIGGKEIIMLFEGECCAEEGDFLRGQTYGLLQSTVSPAEMDIYMDKLKKGFGGLIDTLSAVASAKGTDGHNTIADLQATISNMATITKQLDFLLAKSSKNLNATFQNVASISDNLKNKNDEISGIIQNTESVVTGFKEANLSERIVSLESNVGESLKKMDETLKNANEAFENLNSILDKINRGEGLLGQLTQDKDLYDRVGRVSHNLDLLLQDLRLNPKRYINVSVFGKKQKDYEVPEDDPAFTNQENKN